MHGTLTLHGVAKPVVLEVKLNKIGDNMMKKKTAGFTITTMLKRSDFGMDKYASPCSVTQTWISISNQEANVNEGSPAKK